MEKIKEELILLFDGMLPRVEEFKRKTYETVFEEGFRAHKGVISDIAELCSEKPEEEKTALIEELAETLPEHALEIMQGTAKRKQEKTGIDFNMNMAVYVVPILTYTKEENCERLAARTVELWNEKKINTLTLSLSSYEAIAGGFRKGLCYITTAVCESQGKPDDCRELTMLRGYRDGYLMSSPEGQRLVEEYYDTAPYLVQVMNMQPDKEQIFEELYRTYLSPCLACIDREDMEACRRIYVDMVRGIRKKYKTDRKIR